MNFIEFHHVSSDFHPLRYVSMSFEGVHAAGNYVALLLRAKKGDALDYVGMLNGVLPLDIRILAAERAPESFDARHSCLYRIYQRLYSICSSFASLFSSEICIQTRLITVYMNIYE